MAQAAATFDAAGAARPAPADVPPSPQDEARAFWRMRGRMVRTMLRQVLKRSRLRITLIAVLSTLLWVALFWLFVDGFQFLSAGVPHAPTYKRIVHAVFFMFYAALMVMLTFSSGIILYSGLFRAPDVAFLLTIPARAERVFLHKFQEAVLLSSWAFVLLGSPMILAYGITSEAPWYFYALLIPFLVAFTYTPAAVGAMACMAVVRWMPAGRRHFLILVGAGVTALGFWIVWSVLGAGESDLLTASWFQEILQRLRFSEQRLLPSWWLSMGLLEAAGREWSESVLFLAVMISNALFFRQAGALMANRIYRAAYSRLHGHRHVATRRRGHRTHGRLGPLPGLGWIDDVVHALPLLRPQTRLMIVKDLRLFRRDPVQWSQFLIFFGLLGLYFVNIRRFTYDYHYVGWVNTVSFLNLSVVGLLLSTFTTRFVFPMISLEGQRFWTLGLLPVARGRILWSKFLFAAGGSILPCSLLIFLSDLMLNVAPLVLASHQLTCVILSLGLSGIAVGLGAIMPNLREPSPSKIAAGFGGTLNLVLSSLFIVVVVAWTALPCHFYLASQATPAAAMLAERAGVRWWLSFWLAAGTLASVVLGIVATVVPLWLGARAFRRLEF